MGQTRQWLKRYYHIYRRRERAALLRAEVETLSDPSCVATITGLPKGNLISRPTESATLRIEKASEELAVIDSLLAAVTEFMTEMDAAVNALRDNHWEWFLAVEYVLKERCMLKRAAYEYNKLQNQENVISESTMRRWYDEGVRWVAEELKKRKDV